MADQTNSIDLIVSDKGVDTAAQRVIVLADASDRAEVSVGKLKAQLNDIRAGGLSSLLSGLEASSAVTQTLRTQTDGLATAQRASADASRASTAATQVESAAIKGLVGTKTELREIERAMAQERKSAAAISKLDMQAEASERQALISSVLAEMKAEDSLRALRQQQRLETMASIDAEQELARARELSALKKDIQTRNPPISGKEAAAATQLEAQAALQAENDALIAQYAQLTEAETIEAAAQAEQSVQTDILTAAYTQLAAAQIEVNQAKTLSREVNSAITEGYLVEEEALNATAFAMQRKMEASEGLVLAEQQLAEVQEYLSGAEAASVEITMSAAQAENALATAQRERIAGLAQLSFAQTAETAATAEGVAANVGASASLGLLEGRTMSMTRAAANFLTKVAGLGPIIQAAFPIIGAIALISVLAMAWNAFDKAEEKAKAYASTVALSWQKATDSIVSASLTTETEVDKMQAQLDKLQHKPEQNGLVIAFDESAEAANRLGVMIDKDIEKVDELLKKNKQSFWQGLLTPGPGTEDLSKTITGINAQLEEVKSSYQQVYDTINAETDRSDADKTKNIAENRELEMAALIKVYKDADDKLTPLIRHLREQQKDFNDPLRKATGTAGSDPSSQIALAVGAQSFFAADQNEIGQQYRKDTLTPQIESAKAAKAAATDAGKAAREQWAAATQAFKDYQNEIRDSGKNETPQQDKSWWEGEIGKLMAANKPKADDEIGKFQGQINSQNHWADDQVAAVQQKAEAMKQYGQTLRETTALEKFEQEATARNIPLAQIATQIAAYQAAETAIQSQREFVRALSEDNKNAKTNEDAFTAAVTAQFQVISQYPQFTSTALTAIAELTDNYRKATDPMYEFEIGMKRQADAMSVFGQEERVQVGIENLLANAKKNHLKVTEDMITQARTELTAADNEAQRHKDLAEIYQNETDKLNSLKIAREAIATAHTTPNKEGATTTTDQYQSQLNQNKAQTNQTQIDSGQGTIGKVGFNALANYASEFKGVAQSMEGIMSDMTKKLGDGIGDVFSKWIVYGGNLKTMFKGLAQEVLQGLIGALIKMGIQWALNAVLATTAAAEATAASVAMAATLAAAWGPVAVATSIGSFGAADAAAAAGAPIAGAAIAAAMSMGSLHLAGGGYVNGPGTSTSDSVPAMLSAGEYVWDAQTVKDHYSVIAGIHQGYAVGYADGGPVTQTMLPMIQVGQNPDQRGMNVEVHNYGGAHVETQKVDENRVRVIVREMGPDIVAQHAPRVIAGDIDNPNGQSSKSIRRNITPQRSY